MRIEFFFFRSLPGFPPKFPCVDKFLPFAPPFGDRAPSAFPAGSRCPETCPRKPPNADRQNASEVLGWAYESPFSRRRRFPRRVKPA